MSVQKKVNIIMSTYNGEHFLVEQLDSLCNQTYENIDIYIRDDGSTDNTREILKKYIAENESSKRIIYVDDENGLRYPKCFIKLLLESEKADYYAFCDQDDVWNSDKIEKGVKELEKFENENNKPLLYYTAVDYYDEKLNFVRHSKFASHLIKDTKEYCRTENITYLTTLDFLWYAKKNKVMTEKECNDFIQTVISKNSILPNISITIYTPTINFL